MVGCRPVGTTNRGWVKTRPVGSDDVSGWVDPRAARQSALYTRRTRWAPDGSWAKGGGISCPAGWSESGRKSAPTGEAFWNPVPLLSTAARGYSLILVRGPSRKWETHPRTFQLAFLRRSRGHVRRLSWMSGCGARKFKKLVGRFRSETGFEV